MSIILLIGKTWFINNNLHDGRLQMRETGSNEQFDFYRK